MGMHAGLFVRSDLAHLRDRAGEAPSRIARRADGCDWLALDVGPDFFFGDEAPLVDTLCRLSEGLEAEILLLQGDTRSCWSQVIRCEQGKLCRLLDVSDAGWRLDGDTAFDWEVALIDASYEEEWDFEDERAAMSPPDRAVIETKRLQEGATIPMATAERFARELGIEPLLWGAGERIELRPPRSLWARLFGGS